MTAPEKKTKVGSKMISRRQIIKGQQEPTRASMSTSSGASSSNHSSNQGRSNSQQQVAAPAKGSRNGSRLAPSSRTNKEQQQQQQDSSDGYVAANQYEDYADEIGKEYWRREAEQEAGDYRQFDPYSIYEDEVWFSEERLFEDHLDEIFKKWNLLDDDVWCKVIIMERNRRVGKAYARVPIVTIDGSHTLSYDGYRLALNGFDNPDRDTTTEECKKRIGKGIRIKMDNLGNILIKRLSKAGVYIKEWIQPVSSSGGSNSSNGRTMPSRQQVIKNQLAAMSGNNHRVLGSQLSSSLANSSTPTSSTSGSSMEPPNDSAICDEVISVGGRLDQDKIYVMFDMKKFQANITQELCRPYPDRKKLEQQCFSIVGLVRDAEEILNLPCWVMVINIVAIEMLNERFPFLPNHQSGFVSNNPMLLDGGASNQRGVSNGRPNFVSIFEQNNNNGRHTTKDEVNNKEEDPYSLPANASSSDIKSSINCDYGTANLLDSNGHPMAPSSRHYRGSRKAEMYSQKRGDVSRGTNENPMLDQVKHRSKSNCNIYGMASSKMSHHQNRYNNSSSIYSPGHMLVQPPTTNDALPPKLPPRDFVKKAKSKSSSNITSYDETNIKLDPIRGDEPLVDGGKVVRKNKKNRFLESLKAPLELAKSNRSASVLGAPVQQVASGEDKKSVSKSKGFTKTSAKNFRSFLGVAKSSKSSKQDSASDDSNYVHVDGVDKIKGSSDGVDSAVDSNEDVDELTQHAINSSSSASYNDLDIPTPDYETDENIYALEDTGKFINRSSGGGYTSANQDNRRANGSKKTSGKSAVAAHSNKEDLYYSGFRAHVPSNGVNSRTNANGKGLLDDKMSCLNHPRSRRDVHTSNKLFSSNKLCGRGGEMIYGSTNGVPSMSGSRYRSASMQRYYPGSQTSNLYDIETENPYAMSGSVADSSHLQQRAANHSNNNNGHYGLTNGLAHRRRSSSKSYLPIGPTNGTNGITTTSELHRVAPNLTNSNYDIGRSSSGIYGNNSSSSSSDYADWHPQMRKVNSSGYLNSIFKNQLASQHGDPFSSTTTNPLNNNNKTSSNGNPKLNHSYDNNKQRNYNSRTLKSSRPASTLSKQQAVHQHQTAQIHHHQVASSIVNGPTYRSYDSSNDSEPSYTNSSDGLDIYDYIGANRGLSHHHHLDMTTDTHNLAPEVHVGEWENMYDR